jgi:hypothetical protein
MSSITITLPDSLQRRLQEIAEKDGVTVDEFVSTIVSQRIAVGEAQSLVQARAARGSGKRLVELLDSAPDVDPEPGDELPETANKSQ